MTKKNKNIIAIVISIILAISIILTFHFGKTSERDNTIMNMGNQMKEKFNNNQNSDGKRPDFESFKNERRNRQNGTSTEKNGESASKEKTDEEETVKEPSVTEQEKDTSKRDFDINDFKGQVPGGVRQNKGLTTLAVILIGFESFLLGGCIMFLVMNNFDKEEKKSKKEK